MSLEERFEQAGVRAKGFTSRPTDVELLELYGLFKQASVGDNDTSKPGMFDLKGKAKWQYWTDRKGMSKEEAMEAYIAKVDELEPKYT